MSEKHNSKGSSTAAKKETSKDSKDKQEKKSHKSSHSSSSKDKKTSGVSKKSDVKKPSDAKKETTPPPAAEKAPEKKEVPAASSSVDGSNHNNNKTPDNMQLNVRGSSANNSTALSPRLSDATPASNSSSEKALSPRSASNANFKLDVCAGCGKTIMGDVSHAMNKKWHIYCFVCVACQVPVSDEYYENDGKPYCRRDFNKLFGVICAGCKKALSGKKLKALDKEWHPQCFVCFKCKKPFPDMEYYDIDQQPYCETCYDEEEEKLLKADGSPS